MTKFDRQLFVATGAQGGAAKGTKKVRGTSEYYKNLSAKAAQARAKKRSERKRNGQ